MPTHPYLRLFIGDVEPDETFDNTQHYEVGDVIIVSGIPYTAVDVTTGAAVWSSPGSGGSFDLAAAIDGAAFDGTPDLASTLVSTLGGGLQKTDLESLLENIITPSLNGVFEPADGWLSVPETWTYASGDDPVYQIYVSGNVSSDPWYRAGNKVKCTNNSTTFYGIIVKVGSYDAGNNRTPIDLYGGTDYDLANSAITSPHISKSKSPDGFPLSPDKWTVSLSDTSDQSQASPASNTLYNLGSLSLNIPIGVWRVYYELALQFTVTLAAAQNRGFQCTLSTANNSESDSAFTATFTFALPAITGGIGRATVHREKLLSLTSKTTYYLLASAGGATTATSINFRGDVIATTVKCVCAYL